MNANNHHLKSFVPGKNLEEKILSKKFNILTIILYLDKVTNDL